VILALMAGQPLVLGVWIASVWRSYWSARWRAGLGAPPLFHMELPPLRVPRAGNVLVKTYTRMQWYFLEVLPLFLLASVRCGSPIRRHPAAAVAGLEPAVAALGLPADAARIFLFGFFRRDYGAAGLYDLNQQGLLDPVQLAVAGVTLTLFVPCIAQFLMMMKERGAKTALAMLAF
jgi:ferrous iron transport protein B